MVIITAIIAILVLSCLDYRFSVYLHKHNKERYWDAPEYSTKSFRFPLVFVAMGLILTVVYFATTTEKKCGVVLSKEEPYNQHYGKRGQSTRTIRNVIIKFPERIYAVNLSPESYFLVKKGSRVCVNVNTLDYNSKNNGVTFGDVMQIIAFILIMVMGLFSFASLTYDTQYSRF